MGIKTSRTTPLIGDSLSLKNLPTTWGLRPILQEELVLGLLPLKNLPTTWGLRLHCLNFVRCNDRL